MRFVSRAKVKEPKIFTSSEIRKISSQLIEYYQRPYEERAQRRAPIEMQFFSEPEFLEVLSELFSHKCAFCEFPIGSIDNGTINHYRPLSNAQNLNSNRQSYDHYGWFAYEWKNLLYVCSQCASAKANYFPVKGARSTLLCSWEDAQEVERSLLLNPTEDQPWKHLRFYWDGFVSGLSKKGKFTIEILQLNSSFLISARSKAFNNFIDQLRVIIKSRSDSITEGDLKKLGSYIEQESPFSGALSYLIFEELKAIAKLDGIQIPAISAYFKDPINFLRQFNFSNIKNFLSIIESSGAKDLPENSYATTYKESVAQFSIDEKFELGVSAELSRGAKYIQRVEIESFKCIGRLSLDFMKKGPIFSSAPNTMLLGENACGKSSVLQAIALCLMDEKQFRALGISARSFIPRDAKAWQYSAQQSSRVTVYFNTGEQRELSIDPLTGAAFHSDTDSSVLVMAYGAHRSFNKRHNRRRLKVANVRSLFDPTKMLPDPTEWLEDLPDREFFSVARAMREILALHIDDEVIRDEHGMILISAHGREAPLNYLSDGYKALFLMVINIMRELIYTFGNLEDAPGIVLIDEIELHMHPRWKMKVMAALRGGMPRVQFITSTHDPLCLRGMYDGEVHVLFRDEDLQIKQLENLPNVRGLRSEQLLTSDYFGLASTSDEDLEEELENVSKISSEEGGYERARERIDKKLSIFEVLGDSQSEQIVNEAIKRYLSESKVATPDKRQDLREDAISSILNILRQESE